MPPNPATDRETRVLIVAPTRRDGEVTLGLLSQAGVTGTICGDAAQLAIEIGSGAAALLMTDSVPASAGMQQVLDVIASQPTWSDLPIIVLTREKATSPGAAGIIADMGNVILLDRPASARSVVSAVKAAIRSRQRQYDVRDQIAATQRAESALRLTTERLTLGVQVARFALAEVNYHTNSYELSAEAAKLFGFGDEATTVPRDTMHERMHPADREMVKQHIAACLDSAGPGWFTVDYRIVRPDGTVRWLHERKQVFFDSDRRPRRAVIAALDVTERKQLENDLRKVAADLSEANHRKNEFLATLAHELRNPLAPIRTGLELIRMAVHDPVVVEDTRSMMERQTQQMVRLIDDLLDLSRITQGKLNLRKARVELAAVLHNAVDAIRPFIAEAGHRLLVDLPDEPILLDGDPNRLAQVFSNLLSNAAKYTKDGGTIRLTAAVEDGVTVVTVQDDGIGIPAEMQHRIFEMFAQIDRAIEAGYTGLGIGLTLVKRIVELHDGSISVRSEGTNRGSEFTVRLPLAPAVPPPSVAHAAADLNEKPRARRVLVVDDNKAAAEMLAKVLKIMGNDVRLAYDGLEAIQSAEEFRPNLVLMDLGMPKCNGFEAARQIRERSWSENLTLVALTGWGQDEDKQRSIEAGFDYHLTKPAEPAAIQQLLAKSERPL